MPIIIENELDIYGTREEIKKLWNIIRLANTEAREDYEGVLHTPHTHQLAFFAALHPEPDSWDSGGRCWNDWAWGTKHEADVIHLQLHLNAEEPNINCQYITDGHQPPDGIYQMLVDTYDVRVEAVYDIAEERKCGRWRGHYVSAEEGGVGCYNPFTPYTIEGRTELWGFVPEEYVPLQEEEVGGLLYFYHGELKKVIGLMLGDGEVMMFENAGFGAAVKANQTGVECYGGYFYADEWTCDSMSAWMEDNPTLCQYVNEEEHYYGE